MNKYIYRWSEGNGPKIEVVGGPWAIYRASIMIGHGREHVTGEILTEEGQPIDREVFHRQIHVALSYCTRIAVGNDVVFAVIIVARSDSSGSYRAFAWDGKSWYVSCENGYKPIEDVPQEAIQRMSRKIGLPESVFVKE